MGENMPLHEQIKEYFDQHSQGFDIIINWKYAEKLICKIKQLQDVIEIDRHEYGELSERYKKIKEENEFLMDDIKSKKELNKELEKKIKWLKEIIINKTVEDAFLDIAEDEDDDL